MELVYPQIVTGADLLRSINKLNYLAPLLSRRGAIAASIVNSNMYGVPSFYKIMKKYDIHPVIGLTVHLSVEEEQSVHAYVYAKTDVGYRNLLKMSSAISTTRDHKLPLHWLKAYGAGCLLVCAMTDESWEEMRQEKVLKKISQYHPASSLSIGISRPGGRRHIDEKNIEDIAHSLSLPIIATHESKYVFPEDAFAFKVAQAIRDNKKLTAEELDEDLNEFSYLATEEELENWFEDRLEWLSNAKNLLLSCQVTLQQGDFLMPSFPLEEGISADYYLAEKCYEGLEQRIGQLSEHYEKRLQYELQVIQQMGFADYFLIVEDFISFATQSNILTGPGRGSSAGSLVAFALGITDVDPLQYGLIFERFLNPERVTMPDIDIDFADHRRHEVIEYVAKKYGKAYVAQISTFGTLSARAVAREVARVFSFTTEEMSYISSQIPNRAQITLKEAFKESKALREWIQMGEIRKRWFETAMRLEGLPRNSSTHAAGIILSPEPLVNLVPLQENHEDDLYLTQWPMGDVEEQGLLKIDFLGLRNLTLLDRIQTMLRYDQKNLPHLHQIPLNDRKTFQLFQRGEMTGVFQFESAGMRDTLMLIQPNRFEDLFAINALYRPGPMDYIPNYARRKSGHEQVAYLHPKLAPILEETYGIVVYQEQIMQIFVQIAGYTMGEADLVRRAISKKNYEKLNQERDKFIERARENGVSQQVAHDIFSLVLKFANYGFPKSHAVAYSLISYQLAYFKANTPSHFYAALLSSLAGNREKINDVMSEAKARGIQFLPPSIHFSKYQFTVENGAIRTGLGAIQGITPSFYEQVKNTRPVQRTWASLFDCAVDLGNEFFTEKIVTQLIKAGAFDEFNQSRGVLLASIDAAISHVKFIGSTQEDDSFASVLQSITSPKYSPGDPLSIMKTLAYEREVLGFYLSEHPTTQVKKRVQDNVVNIREVNELQGKSFVTLVGLVTEVKKIRTKKGEPMAFVKIQDATATISCTFFPRQYALYAEELHEMNIIVVQGNKEQRRGIAQIVIQTMKKIETEVDE